MLIIHSFHEDHHTVSSTQLKRLWDHLTTGGYTTHSGLAITLPWLLRRLEQTGVPYNLTAVPRIGYTLRLDRSRPELKFGRDESIPDNTARVAALMKEEFPVA